MVKGVLIDLSGVVYSGPSLLPGATAAIKRLNAAGLPFRFVTNTTSKPRAAILDQLAGFGLTVKRDHVFTPAIAAVTWLAEKAVLAGIDLRDEIDNQQNLGISVTQAGLTIAVGILIAGVMV